MATKKKTPNDIYEEVKAMAVSKTTTFEEEIPEPYSGCSGDHCGLRLHWCKGWTTHYSEIH